MLVARKTTVAPPGRRSTHTAGANNVQDDNGDTSTPLPPTGANARRKHQVDPHDAGEPDNKNKDTTMAAHDNADNNNNNNTDDADANQLADRNDNNKDNNNNNKDSDENDDRDDDKVGRRSPLPATKGKPQHGANSQSVSCYFVIQSSLPLFFFTKLNN